MPETTTPIRDRLTTVIAEAHTIGCPDCGPGVCPRHAADAVLDAARAERLVILTVELADQIVEQARAEGARHALEHAAEVIGRG